MRYLVVFIVREVIKFVKELFVIYVILVFLNLVKIFD